MSERERWIVYPLLFLALGAALRDKIIKTTESQRIKCQGLCVFDSDDKPLLVLGPEQFPELRPDAPNLLRVDEVLAGRVISDTVAANKLEGGQFLTKRDDVGILDAEIVVAKNYVLTDGTNNLRLDGRYTVPLMRILASFVNSRQAAQVAPPQPAPNTESVPPASEATDSTAIPEVAEEEVAAEAVEETAAQGEAPANSEPKSN